MNYRCDGFNLHCFFMNYHTDYKFIFAVYLIHLLSQKLPACSTKSVFHSHLKSATKSFIANLSSDNNNSLL